MIPTTPVTLLEKIRNQDDRESWTRFVGLYGPFLEQWCRRKLQEADAQDAVNDIIIKLYDKLPEFEYDPAKGRFRGWLFRVTSNVIDDVFRKRRRDGKLRDKLGGEEPDQQQDGNDDEEAFRQQLKCHILKRVLEQIRAESREQSWRCFEERILRGRPAKEIAAELDLKPNTVVANAIRMHERVLVRYYELAAEELTDD